MKYLDAVLLPGYLVTWLIYLVAWKLGDTRLGYKGSYVPLEKWILNGTPLLKSFAIVFMSMLLPIAVVLHRLIF